MQRVLQVHKHERPAVDDAHSAGCALIVLHGGYNCRWTGGQSRTGQYVPLKRDSSLRLECNLSGCNFQYIARFTRHKTSSQKRRAAPIPVG